jgi:hypothetical protein
MARSRADGHFERVQRRDPVAPAGHSVGSDCRQEIASRFLKVLRHATCRRRRAEFLWHILGHNWVRDRRGGAHDVLIDLAPRPGLEPGTCGLTGYRRVAHFQQVRPDSVPQFPRITPLSCPEGRDRRTLCGTAMLPFGVLWSQPSEPDAVTRFARTTHDPEPPFEHPGSRRSLLLKLTQDATISGAADRAGHVAGQADHQ